MTTLPHRLPGPHAWNRAPEGGPVMTTLPHRLPGPHAWNRAPEGGPAMTTLPHPPPPPNPWRRPPLRTRVEQGPRRGCGMTKVALRGLLSRKLRSVLTGFAVVVGVAFVVGT